MDEIEASIFKIIAHSGDAKSCLVEAINFAKEAKFDEANEKIKTAKENKLIANESHLALLEMEMNNKDFKMSLLIAHCEDQMMSIETFELLAKELIYLYKKLL